LRPGSGAYKARRERIRRRQEMENGDDLFVLERERSIFLTCFLCSLSDIELGARSLLALDPVCKVELPGRRGEFGRFEDGLQRCK